MNGNGKLEARELACERGGRRLFEGLSFEVPAGSSLVVTGDNGSGKTTLLRILIGLIQPDDGQVLWDGAPTGEEFRSRMRYIGHHSGLKDGLTAAENLRVSAALAGEPASSVEGILAELQLSDYGDQTLATLSAGQKRRLALGRLLLGPAAVWVLDEPFTALDAARKDWIQRRIEAHTAAGGIAVVASHEPLRLAGTNSARLEL